MNPMWWVVLCATVEDCFATLQQALSGSRASMNQLVRCLMPVIRSTVRYALRRRGKERIGGQDGDDLVQEVWTHLFANDAKVLRDFDPSRGNLEAYVTVVARSKTRGVRMTAESQRRGGDQYQANVDDMFDLEGGDDPEAQAMSHELMRRLKKALNDDLPERGRLVFAYIYVDGKKPADAAKLMRVNTQVIYNWQHKIRTIIRAVRESMDPDPEPTPT